MRRHRAGASAGAPHRWPRLTAPLPPSPDGRRSPPALHPYGFEEVWLAVRGQRLRTELAGLDQQARWLLGVAVAVTLAAGGLGLVQHVAVRSWLIEVLVVQLALLAYGVPGQLRQAQLRTELRHAEEQSQCYILAAVDRQVRVPAAAGRRASQTLRQACAPLLGGFGPLALLTLAAWRVHAAAGPRWTGAARLLARNEPGPLLGLMLVCCALVLATSWLIRWRWDAWMGTPADGRTGQGLGAGLPH